MKERQFTPLPSLHSERISIVGELPEEADLTKIDTDEVEHLLQLAGIKELVIRFSNHAFSQPLMPSLVTDSELPDQAQWLRVTLQVNAKEFDAKLIEDTTENAELWAMFLEREIKSAIVAAGVDHLILKKDLVAGLRTVQALVAGFVSLRLVEGLVMRLLFENNDTSMHFLTWLLFSIIVSQILQSADKKLLDEYGYDSEEYPGGGYRNSLILNLEIGRATRLLMAALLSDFVRVDKSDAIPHSSNLNY